MFLTTADRTAYLTNPRRYAGQIVSDVEENLGYILNSTRDAWLPLVGTSGYSGSVGPQGISGYSGSLGLSGYSGVPGVSGYSGVQGTSGYSGAQGTSITILGTVATNVVSHGLV